MGSSTYTLAGGSLELREGTKEAAEAAVIAAAEAAGFGGLTIEEAEAFFGIEAGFFPSLCLSDDRPPYFEEKELPGGFREGQGGYIVAQALAPFVKPGCWHMYETDSEPWGFVFDGQTIQDADHILPAFPGLTLHCDGKRFTITQEKVWECGCCGHYAGTSHECRSGAHTVCEGCGGAE